MPILTQVSISVADPTAVLAVGVPDLATVTAALAAAGIDVVDMEGFVTVNLGDVSIVVSGEEQ